MSLSKVSNVLDGTLDNPVLIEELDFRPREFKSSLANTLVFNTVENPVLDFRPKSFINETANIAMFKDGLNFKPLAFNWSPSKIINYLSASHVKAPDGSLTYSWSGLSRYKLLGDLEDGWNYLELEGNAGLGAYGISLYRDGVEVYHFYAHSSKLGIPNDTRISVLWKLPEGQVWIGWNGNWYVGNPNTWVETDGAAGAPSKTYGRTPSSVRMNWGIMHGSSGYTVNFRIYNGTPAAPFTELENLGLA